MNAMKLWVCIFPSAHHPPFFFRYLFHLHQDLHLFYWDLINGVVFNMEFIYMVQLVIFVFCEQQYKPLLFNLYKDCK